MDVIRQRVRLNAPARRLFEAFLDSRQHSAITGAPARMSRRPGTRFTAHGPHLRGRNLIILPHQLIVQSWRSSGWRRNDPDSILILRFSDCPGGGQIDLVHVGVPAHDQKGVRSGWPKYYWQPWKKYLARQRITSRPARMAAAK